MKNSFRLLDVFLLFKEKSENIFSFHSKHCDCMTRAGVANNINDASVNSVTVSQLHNAEVANSLLSLLFPLVSHHIIF